MQMFSFGSKPSEPLSPAPSTMG